MKIAILGGDGFCGWPAALHLSARGHDVVVVDNFSRRAIDVRLGTESLTPIRGLDERRAAWQELTDRRIGAADAQARGLVNHAVPPEQVDAQVARLVDSIVAKPRLALAMGKELFYRQREMGIEAAYQLAAQTMAANMMEGCALEGVTAFTEKRKPNWTPSSD